jgi:hypothetical protein
MEPDPMRHELSTEIALRIRAYLEERQSIDQLLDWVLLNALGPDRIRVLDCRAE